MLRCGQSIPGVVVGRTVGQVIVDNTDRIKQEAGTATMADLTGEVDDVMGGPEGDADDATTLVTRTILTTLSTEISI